MSTIIFLLLKRKNTRTEYELEALKGSNFNDFLVVCTLCVTNVYHLSGNIQAEFCSHIFETIFKTPHHQKYTVYSLISLYLSVRKEWNFVGWHYQRGRREPFNLYFPMRDLHGDDHFLMLMVLWWE